MCQGHGASYGRNGAQPRARAPRGCAVYRAHARGATGPPAAPGAPDAPAPSPQVHLAITPIAGEAARIRVTVEQVRWPPAQAALLGEADWRAAVDAIAIDPAYDGRTLRVALADGPLKRARLVAGDYTLPAQAAWREGARIAVRVTDIWGQETLAVQDAPDSGADS